MNKAFLTVGIILLGIIALAGINLIGNYSMGNELDYYTLKESTQAAMTDAIDYNYYYKNCTLRMDKEKFVESFIFRFANAVNNARNYEIRMVDINEVPPKVSVEVKAGNKSWNPAGTNFTSEDQKKAEDNNNVIIQNRLDGILVSEVKENPVATKLKQTGNVYGKE